VCFFIENNYQNSVDNFSESAYTENIKKTNRNSRKYCEEKSRLLEVYREESPRVEGTLNRK
jgi:hypothetical protein